MIDRKIYNEIIPKLLNFWINDCKDQEMECALFVGVLRDALCQRLQQIEDAQK